MCLWFSIFHITRALAAFASLRIQLIVTFVYLYFPFAFIYIRRFLRNNSRRGQRSVFADFINSNSFQSMTTKLSSWNINQDVYNIQHVPRAEIKHQPANQQKMYAKMFNRRNCALSCWNWCMCLIEQFQSVCDVQLNRTELSVGFIRIIHSAPFVH